LIKAAVAGVRIYLLNGFLSGIGGIGLALTVAGAVLWRNIDGGDDISFPDGNEFEEVPRLLFS
jgi:hypothetical protein